MPKIPVHLLDIRLRNVPSCILRASAVKRFIRNLADRLEYLRGLETRKGEVKNSIENQGKLTEELAQKIKMIYEFTEDNMDNVLEKNYQFVTENYNIREMGNRYIKLLYEHT